MYTFIEIIPEHTFPYLLDMMWGNTEFWGVKNNAGKCHWDGWKGSG